MRADTRPLLRGWLTFTALALLLGATAGLAGQGGGGGQGGGSTVGPGSGGPPPFVMPTPAPAPTTPEGTGAISGVVLDGSTKTPLAGAIVYLAIEGRPVAGGGFSSTQSREVTDTKGRFAFANLPPGEKYTLSASLFGYLDGGYSREIKPGTTNAFVTLKDGDWIADARIALWRPGAIGGAVLDERGEPVVGVFVRVLSRIRIHGRPELAAGPITTTDDRGMYRLAGLGPGRYLVEVPSVHASVTAAPSGPGSPAAPSGSSEPALEIDSNTRLVLRTFPVPPPPVGGRAFAYPIAFHPGTPAVASATEIALNYGEERSGVDIALQPVQVWRVSGTVDGPPESLAGLTLRLIPEGLENLGQGSEVATASVAADGRFTFLHVPGGAYTIDAPRMMTELTTQGLGGLGPNSSSFPPPPGRAGWSGMSQGLDIGPPGTTLATRNFRATLPNYFGRGSVVVSGHDEASVVVPMRPAGIMNGRIAMDLDPNRPTPTPAPSLLIHLEPAAGNPALGYPRSDFRSDTSPTEFTIQGLLAGSYVLRSSLDWVIKSVIWKGQDHTDTSFDAAATQDFSSVEVVVTNNAPILTGTVRDAQGVPAEGAVVVWFPVDRSRWTNYGFSPVRIKTASASNTGTYRVTTLPAGEYYAIAVTSAQAGAWQDPDFLDRAAASATRAAIAWGETKTVDLTMGPIK